MTASRGLRRGVEKLPVPCTVEELKALIHYDPETGIFTRLTGRHRGKAGSKVGQIRINDKLYYMNRIAWYYVTGEWAPLHLDVDHRDRDRSNNRFSNLRLATRLQNNANFIRKRKNYGVRRRSTNRKWSAKLSHAGTIIPIGVFDTEEEAVRAYHAAARALRGEFYCEP